MHPQVDYSIYLVTDADCLQGRSLLSCVEQALAAGVTLVQYRAKDADGRQLFAEAAQLQQLCSRYHVPLLINDRLDIAQAVGAAGVHLGQSDLPCAIARRILGADSIIGVSAHDLQEAEQAVRDGADYLGSGAVFGTKTKADAGTLGLDGLRRICEVASVPVVGIGGVTAANYAQVLTAGAAGAAIVSGILAQSDINATVQELCRLRQLAKS